MSKMQYFTQTHECFYLDGDIATVSITPHAVEQLGDITFVQLPDVEQTLTREEAFGEVESVKTVSELYAPLSGEVVEINTALEDNPELLNEDLENQGWLLKLKLSNTDEVAQCLDAAAYQKFVDESEA